MSRVKEPPFTAFLSLCGDEAVLVISAGPGRTCSRVSAQLLGQLEVTGEGRS